MALSNLLIMMSTVALDIWNHRLALQNNFLDANAGVVISKEDKEKREKIPKRATIINSCFFILFTFISVVFFFAKVDDETKTLLVTLPIAISNILRNPLIARLAFHVNNQIMRQTVEDRRNDEIKAALQKREERRKKREEQENEHANPNAAERIPTVSELVEKNHLRRESSMPRIDV